MSIKLLGGKKRGGIFNFSKEKDLFEWVIKTLDRTGRYVTLVTDKLQGEYHEI